jgi:hypothetical protein
MVAATAISQGFYILLYGEFRNTDASIRIPVTIPSQPTKDFHPYSFTSNRPNYSYSQSEKFKITGAGRLCASGLGSADLSVGCHSVDQLLALAFSGRARRRLSPWEESAPFVVSQPDVKHRQLRGRDILFPTFQLVENGLRCASLARLC